MVEPSRIIIRTCEPHTDRARYCKVGEALIVIHALQVDLMNCIIFEKESMIWHDSGEVLYLFVKKIIKKTILWPE